MRKTRASSPATTPTGRINGPSPPRSFTACQAKLRLRLLSSEGDPFLAAVKAASAKMNELGVAHDLVIVPGPHDYAFNRGPGCAEMLLFQERALRGLASP